MNDEPTRALDPLRPALRADDIDLRIAGVDAAGTVEVVVSFGPATCEECFVGEAILADMSKAVLYPAMPEVRAIKVRRETPHGC